MKKSVSKLLITLILILSVTIGLTMAYFSDLEKSENNIFLAGTLDLKTNDKDWMKPVWTAENMIPI